MITHIYILSIALAFVAVQDLFGEEQDCVSATNVIQVQDFTLSDQYKKKRPQKFPKDKISIFALADRKGSDQLEDWITPFYKRYEDTVDICGVANMKGLPKMLRPMLRGIFKKSIDYPVMMDWTGDVCASLNYQPKVADIFIVARNGHVVHRVSGEASEEKLSACYAAIDQFNKPKDGGAAEKERERSEAQDLPALESTSDGPTQES